MKLTRTDINKIVGILIIAGIFILIDAYLSGVTIISVATTLVGAGFIIFLFLRSKKNKDIKNHN